MADMDASRVRAARVGGLAYLLSFASMAAVNFGIFGRLVIGSDPAQTARNMLLHHTLFRVGVAGDLVYCIGVLVVSAALYVVLKPVSEGLAVFAAFTRLAHGFTWIVTSLNLFTALNVLTNPDYAHAFPPDLLPPLARLYLSGSALYYVGLLFWSVAATVGAYLWLRSGYVPVALAAFGMLGSAWCAFCTSVYFILPSFADVVNLWWFDVPMLLFELSLSVLLLFRGLRPPRLASDQP